MNKAKQLLDICESMSKAGGFNPKDMGLSNAPALWSKSGKAYIAYSEEDGAFLANADFDSDDEKEFTTLKEAATYLASKGQKTDLVGYKAMIKHVYGNDIPDEEK